MTTKRQPLKNLGMIRIDCIDAYNYAVERGYVPLLDARFDLEISLRVQIQRDLFGPLTEHERFYRWVWAQKPHICEETMRPLSDYSAVYVSHILTKGARPDMAHDPRNTNILCLAAHNHWEFGDRTTMRIYAKNLLTIQKLRKEYGTIEF